ncbi:VOC family protein [Wenxinia saemankumensis]|uniref:PhnB protein n=1 Tax=Wenxinia saemankumensis TaxID=1447782 RepID=A0A1M6ERA3_9RHOB|nr:VOC family protein [Wenxinia saemankumensis]SHI87830.1 PhnB protein [Wenxinia saemankumensis]
MRVATPCLFHPGTCREAFTAYAGIFGTRAPDITGFDEPPPDGTRPAAPEGAVMHAALDLGGSRIYGSDDVGGTPPAPMAGCNVHIAFPGFHVAKGVFERLAEGGEVRMPFRAEFWTPGFGALSDRWGIRWMVSVEDGDAS